MSDPELHHSPMIEKILKEMPLKTRLKVPLEMEYLNIILEPDTCCTDDEFKKANEWAERMANGKPMADQRGTIKPLTPDGVFYNLKLI